MLFCFPLEKLEGADNEALVKLFRLKSSLSTQNYHLFNAEGKVQKYADELEIMKDFAAIRLTFYEVSRFCVSRASKQKDVRFVECEHHTPSSLDENIRNPFFPQQFFVFCLRNVRRISSPCRRRRNLFCTTESASSHLSFRESWL